MPDGGSLQNTRILSLRQQGLSPYAIAKQLGISRDSVRFVLAQHQRLNPPSVALPVREFREYRPSKPLLEAQERAHAYHAHKSFYGD